MNLNFHGVQVWKGGLQVAVSYAHYAGDKRNMFTLRLCVYLHAHHWMAVSQCVCVCVCVCVRSSSALVELPGQQILSDTQRALRETHTHTHPHTKMHIIPEKLRLRIIYCHSDISGSYCPFH